jgi:isopenicillin N synthase-like dioxygenase
VSAEHVPLLDLRTFVDRSRAQGRASTRGNERARFVAELGAAFQRFGFISLIGHGIDATLTGPIYAAMQRLFALPEELKRRYVLHGSGGARGFTPFGIETAKDQRDPDLKEFWHVGRELPRDNPWGMQPNVWPSELPEFRPAALALWRALEATGNEVLSACALFLGLAPDWFADKVDHGNSILRPLHYPPLAGTARGVRSAAHEDINLITLLVGAGEPGLELRQRDGSWLAVDTLPGQVVVNVGDMLQRLTNHVLVSTTHRVVNPPAPWCERSRYSVPFFLHPNPEFVIETLPGCVTVERPNRYPDAITADAYLKQRLKEIGLL